MAMPLWALGAMREISEGSNASSSEKAVKKPNRLIAILMIWAWPNQKVNSAMPMRKILLVSVILKHRCFSVIMIKGSMQIKAATIVGRYRYHKCSFVSFALC